MAELVDAIDSKSIVRKDVWVRVPLPALMKILIFTEGTILMHKAGIGLPREEYVRQILEGKQSVRIFSEYVPIGNATEKIRGWKNQGADIIYFSSRRTPEQINDIHSILTRFNFPTGVLEYRKSSETYKDAGDRLAPDVLIEDDCETIGGEKEMISPHLKPGVKNKVACIIVKEFSGIDELPDNIDKLRKLGRRAA